FRLLSPEFFSYVLCITYYAATSSPTPLSPLSAATSAIRSSARRWRGRSRWQSPPGAEQLAPHQPRECRSDGRGSALQPGSSRSTADQASWAYDSREIRRSASSRFHHSSILHSAPSPLLVRRHLGSGLRRSSGAQPYQHLVRRCSARCPLCRSQHRLQRPPHGSQKRDPHRVGPSTPVLSPDHRRGAVFRLTL